MESDQTLIVTNQESPKSEPTEQKVETVSFSQEEYNKALQSERSKAKFALLQELGIKSVDDYKAKVSEYDKAITDAKVLKDSNLQYEAKIEELNNSLVMEKLNISDEFKSDLLTLAKSKITDGVTFEDAAKQVLDRNPNWIRTNNIRMGVERSTVDTQAQDAANRKAAILKRAGL